MTLGALVQNAAGRTGAYLRTLLGGNLLVQCTETGAQFTVYAYEARTA